jgi:hypothetical protein
MRVVLALLIALSLEAAGSAAPQSPGSGLTSDQRNAILGYELTLDRANHLISAMTALTQYLVSLPDFKERMARSAKLTPAERRAQMEQDPKTSEILKKNSLTAQDYLVGVPALRMALMAAQGLTTPNIVASPANVAFAKANLAELKPKMDQADGLGRRP